MEDLDVDAWIVLKGTRSRMRVSGEHSSNSEQKLMTCYCVHDNQTSVFIQGGGFLE
jgi:hypothetical protein